MPIRIFNNLPSQSAQRHLGINNDRLGATIGRVATGLRIAKSADDGAGLALSQRLQSDTRALRQGLRNLTDGITLINAAEGALGEQSGLLIRLREIAAQAATGTIGQSERDTIQLEFGQLRSEFDRIALTTQFNGITLLDGTLASNAPERLEIQTGLNSSESNRINLNQVLDLTAVNSANLGFNTLRVTNQEDASQALDTLLQAINSQNQTRANVGAVSNQLQRSLSTISVSIENLTAAGSQIMDADLAQELTKLTRDQILVQAATAMVGQANLLPQGVLQLIQV
ncbi:MAG: flagellin [Nitrospinaceae bacterium]